MAEHDDWLNYNASEYTVGGKTYRNLEAQVLYLTRKIENMPTVPFSIVEFGTTTYSEVNELYEENKLMICVRNNIWYQFIMKDSTGSFQFGCFDDATRKRCVLDSNGSWRYNAKTFQTV